MSTVVRQLH